MRCTLWKKITANMSSPRNRQKHATHLAGPHEAGTTVPLRDSKADRKAHARTAGRRQSIISDVHTDFTRDSGPAVLRHLLREDGQLGHLRPSAKSQSHALATSKALPSAETVLREGKRYRYLMLNVWRNMDREHCVHRWPLALLHPGSWSLAGQDHVVRIKRDKIFPENYAMRAQVAGHNYKHEWMYGLLSQPIYQ